MRGPCAQLTDHGLTVSDRDAAAGQHQLRDRLQIQGIGLDPPASLDPALFSDMRRIQLQHLPARRPHGRSQQRPVIVPGSFDPDFHRNIRPRQSPLDQREDPLQTRPRHLKIHRTQQTVPARIGDRQRNHRLADIDSHNHRQINGHRGLNRHNKHLRRYREDPADQPARGPKGI